MDVKGLTVKWNARSTIPPSEYQEDDLNSILGGVTNGLHVVNRVVHNLSGFLAY